MAATKVPVYNQKFSGEKSKEHDKLYEFDESDSDPGGQRKGKRLAKKHKPDTSLYTISRKQNAKKGQTKVRQKNKNPKLKGPVRKYNDIMKEVIQRVKIKIRQKEQKDINSNDDIIETTKDNLSPADIHKSDDIIDASFNDDDSDNENVSEQDDPDGSFLDFGADVHSTPIRSATKINVISNVLLHESDSKRKTRSKRKHNPWRFNEAVKRNPHFIILKSSALPCLKQDMVLDHDQVEKIEEHFSKTPRRIETPNKSPLQKSILEYVNSPDKHNQENIPRSSLFDYEEFSPVKTKSPQWTQNRAKRNILGPIQDNAANILPFTSTPAKPSNVRQPFVGDNEDDDIANCFGFEDENTIPSVKGKPSEAKPFRIKEYVAKKQMKQTEEKVVEEALPEPNESEIVKVNDSVEVGLFDDPEKGFSLTVPSIIYVKKPRRKRLKSVGAEKEDELHPKKRKKDMMTKAEEAALEEWAAKFNSMCNEIDKYDLEIE